MLKAREKRTELWLCVGQCRAVAALMKHRVRKERGRGRAYGSACT